MITYNKAVISKADAFLLDGREDLDIQRFGGEDKCQPGYAETTNSFFTDYITIYFGPGT